MNQSSRRRSLYESLLLDQGENPQAGRTPGLWVFGFSYADCGAVLPQQEQTGAHSPYWGMEKVQSAASQPIEKSRALIA